MSNFQNMVVPPTQTGASNQCLTGCMYQIVQNSGTQGQNILQLIPILNTKENPVQAVPPPVIASSPTVNVQQPVRLALPPTVPNAPLPCPVKAQLVQQLGSANYIITTQKNLSGHQNTAVVLDKPPMNLPPNPQPGAAPQSFIIMNAKPGSVPVKAFPFFPAGHGLQIPANGEMKTIPASSLPFSIQHRVLPPNANTDRAKNPSILYVKASPGRSKPSDPPLTTVTQPATVPPMVVPAGLPGEAKPSSGPLKWVVQENNESRACVVPVKSNNDKAMKFVTVMSGAQAEELNLTASGIANITKLKENSLVMFNNKMYVLKKPDGGSSVHVKQEFPDKALLQAEQGKDLANKVVEVVLSKSNLSPPKAKPTPSASPVVRPRASCPAKSKKVLAPLQVKKDVPEVILIDDDDDEDVAVSVQKPQVMSRHPPNNIGPPSELHGINRMKTKDKEPEAPVSRVIDDQTLRAKFGLFKQERIVLNRIHLRRPESRSDSRTGMTDMAIYAEKRKSTLLESPSVLKQRKSVDTSGFSMNTITKDVSGDYYRPPSTTSVPIPGGSSAAVERTCSSLVHNGTDAGYGHVNASTSTQSSDPQLHADPATSLYAGQDIAGHFSEVSLPRQRFHIEPSVYSDETTKDEKIQRLKEVLKEREQALEALRRQKWS